MHNTKLANRMLDTFQLSYLVHKVNIINRPPNSLRAFDIVYFVIQIARVEINKKE